MSEALYGIVLIAFMMCVCWTIDKMIERKHSSLWTKLNFTRSELGD